MKLHRDLGITQKTAWHMAHRIREIWVKKNVPMAGQAEVDETCFCGREANKHVSKKKRLGREGIAKAVIAGAKDPETNRLCAEVVERTDARTLQEPGPTRPRRARPPIRTSIPPAREYSSSTRWGAAEPASTSATWRACERYGVLLGDPEADPQD